MLSAPSSILQRVRTFGSRFFHRFGIHCATHQIRVILISSVVISSLLYPAIAVYSSSQTHFFTFSLRVLDAFLTPDDLSGYFSHEDLRHLWDGYDALRVREDSIARARCGKEGIIRTERILIHHIHEDDEKGPLNHGILLETLKLERRISDLLSSRRVQCVRTSEKRCLSLSPLAFWDYDEKLLLNDENILETLGPSQNATVSGVTITPDMVLAGRGAAESTASDSDATLFLVLTYFFPDTDCLANHGHFTWLDILEEAASSDGDLIMQAQQPRLVALEYEKTLSVNSRLSVLSAFTYTAYLIFVIYFSRSMRRMDTVHSRIGLAFTGIVEIVVSTMTSLSVCALVGFRVTMVPWEIFPIVVIFIGVENMFSIVDAVIKTSIALPVKERIAEGLSRAGTSNTLKLCTYNSVLGVIAFFSSGAIRQFCAFAIVVLVAHWFLVHTFFVTVLSIDIQRLELDELLRQNASLAPVLSVEPQKSDVRQAQTKWGRTVAGIHSLLRGRAGKNISLVLLLAVTATLYYMTKPIPTTNSELRDSSRSPFVRLAKPPIPGSVSPSMQIWRTLNPTNFDLVHIRIESPAILVMGRDINPLTSEDAGAERQRLEYEKAQRARWSRVWSRTGRNVTWLFKTVAVPTVGTTVVLWGLLLYLLKDAELLEAQRNRAEPDSPVTEDTVPAVEGHVTFTTLPRAFPTDVDLIAASKDGSVIATVGLQNEFVLWRVQTQAYSALDASDVLLGSTESSSPTVSSTLTAIAVNARGTYVAVGTGTGVIALWYIGQNRVQALPHLTADTFSAVTNIRFASSSPNSPGQNTPRRHSSNSIPTLSNSDPSTPAEFPSYIYATYDNGTVIQWTIGPFTVPTYVKPSRSASIVKSHLLHLQADDRLLVGFSLEDGSLELVDIDHPDNLLSREFCIIAGNPADLVARVHVCNVQLDGKTHLVVAAATQAGVVSLWDGATGECMCILDEAYGMISDLRLMPIPIKICSTCGELPAESFSLSFSVSPVVLFYRAYLALPTRRCSCPVHQPTVMSSVLGRRCRSGSMASIASMGGSSGTMSPVHSRSRISSFSSTVSAFDGATMYPVSGHGVHSRRLSEKRSFDPFEYDENETHQPVGPQDLSTAGSGSSLLNPGHQRSLLWESLVVVRTADATFERGHWDIVHNKVIGIRRKPRIPTVYGSGSSGKSRLRTSPTVHPRTDSSKGLTTATLERWELWTFDPAECRLQASPLSVLDADTRREDQSKNKAKENGSSSNPGTIKRRNGIDVVPRLHFTRVSPFFSSRSFCIAGFGNTVGLFRFNNTPGARQRPSLDHIRKSSGG